MEATNLTDRRNQQWNNKDRSVALGSIELSAFGQIPKKRPNSRGGINSGRTHPEFSVDRRQHNEHIGVMKRGIIHRCFSLWKGPLFWRERATTDDESDQERSFVFPWVIFSLQSAERPTARPGREAVAAAFRRRSSAPPGPHRAIPPAVAPTACGHFSPGPAPAVSATAR